MTSPCSSTYIARQKPSLPLCSRTPQMCPSLFFQKARAQICSTTKLGLSLQWERGALSKEDQNYLLNYWLFHCNYICFFLDLLFAMMHSYLSLFHTFSISLSCFVNELHRQDNLIFSPVAITSSPETKKYTATCIVCLSSHRKYFCEAYYLIPKTQKVPT